MKIQEHDTIYEGEIFEGKRHGRGSLWFKGGERYEGEWKNGEIDGYGVYYDKSGKKLYEGHYSKGKREGFGIEYNGKARKTSGQSLFGFDNFEKGNESWIKFEGHLKQNEWEGIGKLFFVNGDMFYGEFKNNKISGKGTLHISTGVAVAGIWEGNKLIS